MNTGGSKQRTATTTGGDKNAMNVGPEAAHHVSRKELGSRSNVNRSFSPSQFQPNASGRQKHHHEAGDGNGDLQQHNMKLPSTNVNRMRDVQAHTVTSGFFNVANQKQ